MKQLVKHITEFINETTQKSFKMQYIAATLYCICLVLALCIMSQVWVVIKRNQEYAAAQLQKDMLITFDLMKKEHESKIKHFILNHKNSFGGKSHEVRKAISSLRDHGFAVVPEDAMAEQVLVKQLIDCYMEMKDYLNAHPTVKAERGVEDFLDNVLLQYEWSLANNNARIFRKRIALKDFERETRGEV